MSAAAKRSPRHVEENGIRYRLFIDDRGRERRIKVGPSSPSSRSTTPAESGKEGAAPAPASSSPAEESDAPATAGRGSEGTSTSGPAVASRWPWLVGGAVVLLAGAVAGVALARRRGGQETPSDPGGRHLELVQVEG